MQFEVIKNQDLKVEKLTKIISLKEQYWKHGNESQVAWMKNNLKDNDLHVLMMNNGGGEYNLIAYLNLVNIIADVDEVSYKCIGVGNVCVDKAHEHDGFGQKLMNFANQFIKNNDSCGILLCKPMVRGFYRKTGWIEICPEEAYVDGSVYSSLIMIKNAEVNNNVFLTAKLMRFDRSF